jgi:hypothetical protein
VKQKYPWEKRNKSSGEARSDLIRCRKKLGVVGPQHIDVWVREGQAYNSENFEA